MVELSDGQNNDVMMNYGENPDIAGTGSISFEVLLNGQLHSCWSFGYGIMMAGEGNSGVSDYLSSILDLGSGGTMSYFSLGIGTRELNLGGLNSNTNSTLTIDISHPCTGEISFGVSNSLENIYGGIGGVGFGPGTFNSMFRMFGHSNSIINVPEAYFSLTTLGNSFALREI